MASAKRSKRRGEGGREEGEDADGDPAKMPILSTADTLSQLRLNDISRMNRKRATNKYININK